MAIGADELRRARLLRATFQKSLDDFPRRYVMALMALSAGWIDSLRRVHGLRRCAGSARRPGFVVDVSVTLAVALGTADPFFGVRHGKFFHNQVQVADFAATVIGPGAVAWIVFLGVLPGQCTECSYRLAAQLHAPRLQHDATRFRGRRPPYSSSRRWE